MNIAILILAFIAVAALCLPFAFRSGRLLFRDLRNGATVISGVEYRRLSDPMVYWAVVCQNAASMVTLGALGGSAVAVLIYTAVGILFAL